MTSCKECELNNKRCPGLDGGAYCTELGDESLISLHPANIDQQNAALSCEMSYFYERPALKQARTNNMPNS